MTAVDLLMALQTELRSLERSERISVSWVKSVLDAAADDGLSGDRSYFDAVVCIDRAGSSVMWAPREQWMRWVEAALKMPRIANAQTMEEGRVDF